jgi:hypothetical protein
MDNVAWVCLFLDVCARVDVPLNTEDAAVAEGTEGVRGKAAFLNFVINILRALGDLRVLSVLEDGTTGKAVAGFAPIELQALVAPI